MIIFLMSRGGLEGEWGNVTGGERIRRTSPSLFPYIPDPCRFAQLMCTHYIKISLRGSAPWAIPCNTDQTESGIRAPIFYVQTN